MPPDSKHHIASEGVRLCIHRPRRLRGPTICVHTHVTEILTEPRLHKIPGRCVERVAWTQTG